MQLQKQIKVMQISPIPQISPISTNNPIENWKAYSDNKIGYSFEYPSEWYLEKSSSGMHGVTLKNYTDSQLTKEEKMNVFFGSEPTDKIYIDITEYNEVISNGEQLIDWYKRNGYYTSDMSGDPLSIKDTIVSNNPGIIVHYSGVGDSYIFRSNNRVFKAYFGPLGTRKSQLFHQILSTFKFIENTNKLTCQYQGKTYQEGESFKDACNSCSCESGQVACTLMACAP